MSEEGKIIWGDEIVIPLKDDGTKFRNFVVTGYSDDPLLLNAAKAVAEERQHGCHYAEGACEECVRLALAVLRSAFPQDANRFIRGDLIHRILYSA